MKKAVLAVALLAGISAFAHPHFHHRHSGLYTALDVVNTIAHVVDVVTPNTVVVQPTTPAVVAPTVVAPAVSSTTYSTESGTVTIQTVQPQPVVAQPVVVAPAPVVEYTGPTWFNRIYHDPYYYRPAPPPLLRHHHHHAPPPPPRGHRGGPGPRHGHGPGPRR